MKTKSNLIEQSDNQLKSRYCMRNRRARGLQRWSLVILVLLMGLPSYCFAWTCNKIGAQNETVTGPTDISVSRDVATGAALSDWFYSRLEVYRNCTADTAATMGTQFYATGLTKVSGVTHDGYAVYYTGLDGVGVAMRARGWACAGYGAWWSVEPSFNAGGSCSPVKSLNIGGQVGFRYVKIGAISGGSIDLSNPITAYSQIDNHIDWGGANTRRYLDSSKTTVKVSACSTPDISVPLGNHSPSEFSSVGSRSAPVKFTLAINSCPAGMAGVSYGFNFVSGTGYTPKQGLFGLNADATAKGIQVKLMGADGKTTVELDQWITLSEYKASAGGTYKVDLTAAYQRTGDIEPGTANAELVIAMYYK